MTASRIEMGNESAPQNRRTPARALSLLESAITKVGILATSVSAAAGIGWAAWHYASPPPPPAQLDAHLAEIKGGFYPGISLRQFFALDQSHRRPGQFGLLREQLSCRFAYLQVRVTVDGYSGHQVWLRWVLMDDRGSRSAAP